MARDLDTLLAKVQKSMEESQAMIQTTRRIVESSRHLLRGRVAESVDGTSAATTQETSAEPIGVSPQKPSGEQ
ncbi:MAG: hypothetical protein ACO1TE_19565 [Prosthecobacter sp.]